MKGIKKVLVVLLMFMFMINVKVLNKDIIVNNIEVKDKSGTITVVDPVITSDNEVTSNITFNQKDDFVTLELIIKNNQSKKYKIESITDNNTNTNLKIDYTFSEDYINKAEASKVTIKNNL